MKKYLKSIQNPKTVADVKYFNEANGGHWFGKEEMNFFKTKIETKRLIAGEFFVTSEPEDVMEYSKCINKKRNYSIRFVDEHFEMSTYGRRFDKLLEAKAVLKAVLNDDPNICPVNLMPTFIDLKGWIRKQREYDKAKA